MVLQKDLLFVGFWTEIKLEIIRKYASAYSLILSKQKYIHYVYIDGFCGPGKHISKNGTRFISGSPSIALKIDPPFERFYFIDMDPRKLDYLKRHVDDRNDVYCFRGDCNAILLKEVFPIIKYENYMRALCLLDPYGLHLDWQVIRSAGSSGVIEIFLNFPVADMNRNVFRKRPEKVSKNNIERMNRFRGDESWRKIAYTKEETLLGPEESKEDISRVTEAFRHRLLKVAGFKHVPEPLPMRNSKGAIVYYLFFASWNKTANKIVEERANEWCFY